jgi:outer membrane protein W
MILTFSTVIFFMASPRASKAQAVALKAGVYDFTDNTAREFYIIAPTFLAGYDVWHKSRLSLQVSTGLSFNSIKYNGHHHYLYMVPVLLTVNYELLNPDSRIRPVIGAGMGIMGKADVNSSLDNTHYSFTYGYHATGGLHFEVNKKLTLTLELTYNLLMPPVPEELNVAGLITAIGVLLPVGKGKK